MKSKTGSTESSSAHIVNGRISGNGNRPRHGTIVVDNLLALSQSEAILQRSIVINSSLVMQVCETDRRGNCYTRPDAQYRIGMGIEINRSAGNGGRSSTRNRNAQYSSASGTRKRKVLCGGRSVGERNG